MSSSCGGTSSVALHWSLRTSLSGMCAIHWNDGDAAASPVPLPRESGGPPCPVCPSTPSGVVPFRPPFPGVSWAPAPSRCVCGARWVRWPEPLGWSPFRGAASLGAAALPVGSVPSGPGAPLLGRPIGLWPPMWGWACAIPPFPAPEVPSPAGLPAPAVGNRQAWGRFGHSSGECAVGAALQIQVPAWTGQLCDRPHWPWQLFLRW